MDTASARSEEAFYDVPEHKEDLPIVEQDSTRNSREMSLISWNRSSFRRRRLQLPHRSLKQKAMNPRTKRPPQRKKLSLKLQQQSRNSHLPNYLSKLRHHQPPTKKLTLTIHNLEVLYNPTTFASFTTASPTKNFGFKFSFGGAFPGDNDDSDRNVPTAATPYKDPRHRNRQQTLLQSNRGSSSEASFM